LIFFFVVFLILLFHLRLGILFIEDRLDPLEELSIARDLGLGFVFAVEGFKLREGAFQLG
jgi:hypothetical protein